MLLLCLAALASKQSCTISSDCIYGKICSLGYCEFPQCYNDLHCYGPRKCVKGFCVEAGTCARNYHCPTREICIRGSCQEEPDSCLHHFDCPFGLYCISGQCNTQHYCFANYQCLQGEICQMQNCVLAEPTDNDDDQTISPDNAVEDTTTQHKITGPATKSKKPLPNFTSTTELLTPNIVSSTAEPGA